MWVLFSGKHTVCIGPGTNTNMASQMLIYHVVYMYDNQIRLCDNQLRLSEVKGHDR